VTDGSHHDREFNAILSEPSLGLAVRWVECPTTKDAEDYESKMLETLDYAWNGKKQGRNPIRVLLPGTPLCVPPIAAVPNRTFEQWNALKKKEIWRTPEVNSCFVKLRVVYLLLLLVVFSTRFSTFGAAACVT
jgi:hypothetical protein